MVNGRCQIYTDGALACDFPRGYEFRNTTIIASIVLMLGMLGIGLWLVKKSSNNNKKKGK